MSAPSCIYYRLYDLKKSVQLIVTYPLTGFLAVYKVAYKNPFNVYRHTPEYKLFTKENVHRLGADAIFASKDQGMLVNDEVVVYDDKQATIRYLIELA